MITIIPAIDLIDGKCVRLSQGNYSNVKVYSNEPVEVAKEFESYGIKRLHLVDLDGAKNKKVINWKVLERIVSSTNLSVDFGGGVKTDEDMKRIFDVGASFAVVGSIAVTNSYLFRKWINDFGSEKIILAADVKDMKIAIGGWQENTEIELLSFLKEQKKLGVKNVLCTDISKDGMLAGTSLDIYRTIKKEIPELYLIASGGVTREEEIDELNNMDVEGVILGKAIYEGKLQLKDIVRFIN